MRSPASRRSTRRAHTPSTSRSSRRTATSSPAFETVDAMSLAARAWLWASADAPDAVDVLFVDEAGPALARECGCRRAGGQERSSCSATRSSSSSRSRGATPRGRASRCSSTFSETTRRCRPTGASSSRRPGAWHPPSARSRRRCSTRGGCSLARGVRAAAALGHGAVRGERALGRARRPRGQPQQLGRGGRSGRLGRLPRCCARASPGSTAKGNTRPMTPADVLVVAPYNAHVTLLTERSGRGAFASAPSTSSRARRRPSSSTRWRRRARKMRPAAWSSSTA